MVGDSSSSSWRVTSLVAASRYSRAATIAGPRLQARCQKRASCYRGARTTAIRDRVLENTDGAAVTKRAIAGTASRSLSSAPRPANRRRSRARCRRRGGALPRIRGRGESTAQRTNRGTRPDGRARRRPRHRSLSEHRRSPTAGFHTRAGFEQPACVRIGPSAYLLFTKYASLVDRLQQSLDTEPASRRQIALSEQSPVDDPAAACEQSDRIELAPESARAVDLPSR